jgi:hypothetical protein
MFLDLANSAPLARIAERLLRERRVTGTRLEYMDNDIDASIDVNGYCDYCQDDDDLQGCGILAQLQRRSQ